MPLFSFRSDNSIRLIIPTFKYTRLFRRSFNVTAPNSWNLIPINIRKMNNYNLFEVM